MQISSIDVHTLKKHQEHSTALPFILIDVREQHEWDAGHIEGAVHVPLQTVSGQIQSIVTDVTTPVYLYCRSGGRSLTAGTSLLQQGYTSLFNVEGGITAWQTAGYDVVS